MTELRGHQIYRTGYDRRAASVGVVHLGYGAFHRAHQAVCFDDCMEAKGDLGWGIAAVNLRPEESATFARARLVEDGYLLRTTSPEGVQQLRMVRPHLEFADWAVDAAAAEELIARPGVHAITLTVTESGYYLNDDWSLNTGDPIIAAELRNGAPRSVYGYLAGALEGRAAALDQPLTLMSCDNIRANGRMLENNLLTYLDLTGRQALADWVRGNVRFPCSMVDRITPRSTTQFLAEIDALFPGEVLNPIQSEAFLQWVLEDNFAGPMADLGRGGVRVVADVDPFEEAKIRILNGGHTGLAYLAALAGYHSFDEAMYDPKLRGHFDHWELDEILPGLTVDLPFDKAEYLNQITARFGNRAIGDQLERICMDGWSKMPIYVRPTLASCLRQGIVPRYGFDCVASWYVYARRFDAGSTSVPYHDAYWQTMKPLLAVGHEEAFARTRALWADLPETYPEFVAGLVRAIKEMEKRWPA